MEFLATFTKVISLKIFIIITSVEQRYNKINFFLIYANYICSPVEVTLKMYPCTVIKSTDQIMQTNISDY